MQTRIRLAEDRDSRDLITLIARCFADYPGCILDVDEEEPELRRPGSSFERLWVAVDQDDRVLGCIGAATRPRSTIDDAEGPIVELKKLYIDHRARGTGLARRLVALVEDYAGERAATRIELWTDTRFLTAHAVYEHFGYRRCAPTRPLHDKSNTIEFSYDKALSAAPD